LEQFVCISSVLAAAGEGQQYSHDKKATHATASAFINDNESGLYHDYEVWLEKLAPRAPRFQYHQNRTGEDNADAHLKRQIISREMVVGSRTESSISGRVSRSFTESSTGTGEKGCW
jgi:thiamine phosphate synthase YjbQ (UPF0047 family)